MSKTTKPTSRLDKIENLLIGFIKEQRTFNEKVVGFMEKQEKFNDVLLNFLTIKKEINI